MVEATNLGELDDGARLGSMYGPRLGSVFVQRQMRPRTVIVVKVGSQDSPQVSLAQDDHVIEALSPDRTYDSLDVGILPRRTRRRDHFIGGPSL